MNDDTMEDLPFSNREIRVMFGQIDTKLDTTIEQTTKTNGRVSKLERWQSYVIGFCAAISMLLVTIGIPLMSALISSGRI